MSAVLEMVDGRKVYRPNPSGEPGSLVFGIFFLIVLLLMPFIGVFIEYRKTGEIGSAWIATLVLLGVLIVAAIVRGARRPPAIYLALSPDGLEYQGRKHLVTATWEDVLKLRHDDEPVLVVRSVAANDTPIPKRSSNATEYISLLPFDFDNESELAHDLRTFAPHLFH